MDRIKTIKAAASLTTALSAVLMLTACSGMKDRVSNIGKAPTMSAIQSTETMVKHQPASLPMPQISETNAHENSLWQPNRQRFFKDQRAHTVGDILTVFISITDQAKLENKTERTRTGSETQGLPNLLGVESQLSKVLSEAVDPSALVGMNSESASAGDGSVERKEDINLKLAAMVTQVLPNGNFIIHGTQEVRVNFELRQLALDGIIRPQDILNNNTISYEKIAEARISYGGKGHLTEIQQPRYGQQFFDAVFPF